MLTRNNANKLKNNLISATKIGNCIKNDRVLDYLDLLNNKNLSLNEELKVIKKRSNSFDLELSNKKQKTSFDYIVDSGYYFENEIFKKIEQMMKNNNEFNKLIKIEEKNINLNCSITIQTIKENKHNIILNSVLINNKNNTWGKPDIIAKGIWIEKYIIEKNNNLDLEKWYIIDIKSSTINLINGGEDVSSKLLYNIYKSQIYIYTEALNELMNQYNLINDVSFGFILGKKYKYILNKKNIVKNTFDCLALIDYKKEKLIGNDWSNIIYEAIKWKNNLKSNWETFELNTINNDKLYKNMKNTYDNKWNKIKKNITIINKEITIL